MTIGHRTLLILGILSAVSILLSFLVLRATVYPTFLVLENQAADENLARVTAAIQSQLDGLAILNSEYSKWDDTYEFLHEYNDYYVPTNVNATTLDNLDADVLVILDRKGDIVVGIGRDPNNAGAIPTNDPFEEFESAREAFSVSDSSSNRRVGVVRTSKGPFLATSLPVLPTSGIGEPAGSVLLGRFLDAGRTERIKKQLSVEFVLTPAPTGPNAQEELEKSDPVAVELPRLQDATTILAYRYIQDIFGRAAFLLEVSTPRSVTAAGRQAVTAALVFLAITSLLYLLVSTFSLRRLIIKPVVELTHHITELSGCAPSPKGDGFAGD